MHAGITNSQFPLNSVAGGNVPGIPGTCATRNLTYLVRGPLKSRKEMPHKRAITIYSLSQHIGTKYMKPVTGWKPVPASRPTTSCDHFYISVRSADVSDDIKNENFMYRAAILITVTPLHVRTKYRIKFIHVASKDCGQGVAGIGLHWLVLINGPLRVPTTSKTPLIFTDTRYTSTILEYTDTATGVNNAYVSSEDTCIELTDWGL